MRKFPTIDRTKFHRNIGGLERWFVLMECWENTA
jgi:hypothetical protein